MTNDEASDDGTSTLEIEPASMKNSGRCACCGKSRRTIWGYVYRDGGPRACYFVEWTLGRRDCSARFDVVVGSWFDGTTEDDRETVSLEYRLLDTGPSFSVGDAAGRPAAEIGRAKRGSEIAGTPLADEVVAIAGAILEVDDRVRELAGPGPAERADEPAGAEDQERVAEKPAEERAEKPADKLAERVAEKPAENLADKPACAVT